MEKIFRIDVRELDSFSRIGYEYVKMWQTEKWMLWKMDSGDGIPRYELWKFKKHVNPDGKEIWRKPGDEDFGNFGWYITGSEDYCQHRIGEIMGVI